MFIVSATRMVLDKVSGNLDKPRVLLAPCTSVWEVTEPSRPHPESAIADLSSNEVLIRLHSRFNITKEVGPLGFRSVHCPWMQPSHYTHCPKKAMSCSA